MNNIDLISYNKQIIEKYDQVFFQTKDDDWVIFMNDGYMPLDEFGYPVNDVKYPKLNDLHARWRYQTYLYLELIDQAKKNFSSNLGSLLDIGCGRGGGLSTFRDYCNYDTLVGLDLNPNHVNFAKKTLHGINFVQGSAMDLPFTDNSFDIITNVESANYYIFYDKFVSEVKRILKPNGLFLYADTFDDQRLYNSFEEFKQQKLDLISIKNITANVRAACSLDKYRLLNSSKILADIMMWDEERYYHFRRPNTDSYVADYYIIILQKN